MNAVVFLLYMHRREFLLSYIQDFLLSSSTFHIYTFTIFMGILLSVIHPCEMVIISVTRPQTWLILMFNNGQTLHFVRPQTRLLQVFKALVQTFLHPQHGYALYLLSIVWMSMPWAYCGLLKAQTFPCPFLWTSKLSLRLHISASREFSRLGLFSPFMVDLNNMETNCSHNIMYIA